MGIWFATERLRWSRGLQERGCTDIHLSVQVVFILRLLRLGLCGRNVVVRRRLRRYLWRAQNPPRQPLKGLSCGGAAALRLPAAQQTL
jgi:hypothetical protein